jgi:hypothetical protein
MLRWTVSSWRATLSVVLPRDTSAAANQAQLGWLARLTPAQKVNLAFAMSSAAPDRTRRCWIRERPMSAGELLARFVAKLDAAGIPHMVAGSFARTYHGVPRATHDIDLVIEPGATSLAKLLSLLPVDDYDVDADVARDALRRRSLFNVIDLATGWKLDLIVRKARPFSLEEFRRRQPAEMLSAHVFVATVEDSIIAKLEWSKLGDSERQLRDAAGMLAARRATLDVAYIERWISELGLEEQWHRVISA